MTNPFGYFVFRRDGLDAHAERLNPRAMMFAQSAADAMTFAIKFPQCQVAFRQIITRGDFQEDILHRTAGRTLAYVQARAREVSVNVYINVGCEPQLSQADDLHKLVTEQLAAAQWAVANGRRLVLLHLAHYGLNERHWPVLAPLCDYAAQHRDLLVIGCDEYGAGHLFSGVVDPRVGDPQAGHVPPQTWRRSPVDTYYHVGRITGLLRWLRANGHGVPRVWITEHGVDALGDVDGWRKSLVRTPPYTDIRGWKSLANQWQQWYGPLGWAPARAFGEMVAAARREIYAPYWNAHTREGIEAALLFGWRYLDDPAWEQFDVSEALDFQRVLESYMEVNPMPTFPSLPPANDSGYEDRQQTAAGPINIRSQPVVSAGNEVGTLAAGDVVRVHRTVQFVDSAGTWRPVQKGGALGWARVPPAAYAAPPPVFGDPDVLLGVPFLTQLSTGLNNCGPACLAMLARYVGAKTGRSDLIAITVQEVAARMNKGTGFASLGDLLRTAGLLDMQTAILTMLAEGSIANQLDRGLPFIALVDRGKLKPSFGNFDGAHFVVVHGYGKGFGVVHDPLSTATGSGVGWKVPTADLMSAWASSPGNSVKFAALVLAALAPTPKRTVPEIAADLRRLLDELERV